MKKTWNLTIDGSDYNLTFEKGLSINNGEFVALSKFKKKAHMSECEYFIPLGNQTTVLHIFNSKAKEPILTINNRDCVTGEVHEIARTPAWAWVFMALYIFNFIFIIGGAIGGAICGGLGYLSLAIASDKEKSVVSRVLICIAMYAVTTVLSIFIAKLIFSL